MRRTVMPESMILAAIAVCAISIKPSQATNATASIGATAPSFALQDQDGNEVRLADFSGKVVVLEWFNNDCPFVQRHYAAKTMATLAESFQDQGVVWLAINSTHYATKENNKAWKEKYSLPYPILSDNSGEVGTTYAAKTTPHMYIIDKSGTLVYAGGIDDDPKGESKSPTNYVSKALQEVLAGSTVTTPESKPYGCSVKYPQP